MFVSLASVHKKVGVRADYVQRCTYPICALDGSRSELLFGNRSPAVAAPGSECAAGEIEQSEPIS